MEKFIINHHKDTYLINCILDVVEKDSNYVKVKYKDFNLNELVIEIPISDGEFYTEEVIERRKRELAVRNVLSLMEYHNLDRKSVV